mmetsp:Transcript_29382/g.62408  ORF Transcript_29382/g.62408 Transcript_29382/m.62408 type:complete len:306 (+) Transcript_29382:170-1087(+)
MNSLLMNVVAFLVGLSIGSMIFSTAGLIHCADKSVPSEPIISCPQQPQPSITKPVDSTATTTRDGGEYEYETPAIFDQMNNKLYTMATTPVLLNRKPYTLGAIKNTGGGLDDSDRTLLASIYYNSTSVFEFGLGESTHIAAYVGVPRLAGVDSDAVWVSNARSGAQGMDHFRFTFADIGDLGIYGRALNETLSKIPYNYQSGPLHNELHAFDFYFIDGRYRVACACAAFLHAKSRGGDMSKVMVGFHDWHRGDPTNWNWGYWEMNEIAHVVRLSESKKMAVLKLRENVTEEAIVKMWESHMWDRF